MSIGEEGEEGRGVPMSYPPWPRLGASLEFDHLFHEYAVVNIRVLFCFFVFFSFFLKGFNLNLFF